MTDNKFFRVLKWIFFILAFLILLFVMVFSVSGCANKQELDELTVVSGIAIDSPQNTAGKLPPVLNLAVEYVTISSEGTTGKNVEGQILQLQGENPFSSIRGALNLYQNKLYLAHNQLLVFGREIAEGGLKNYIDFFVRDYEARLNVPILIADGEAAKMLEIKTEGIGLTSEFLKNMIESQSEQGMNSFTKLLDFAENLTSWKKGTLIPLVELDDSDKEKPKLMIQKTAVFYEDKMVGTLDGGQTRGVLWVMGKVKDGLINVETEKGSVVVEITGCKTDKKIEVEDGKLKVRINILQTGAIGSATGEAGYNKDDNISDIQKITEDVIKNEILDSLEAVKSFNCDVYGFGDELRRKENKKWRNISENWDKVFKQAEFIVDVKSTIENTGALGKNI